MRLGEVGQRFGVGLVPGAVLVEKSLGVVAREVVEGQQDVAVLAGGIRLSREGPAIPRDRLLELPLVFEGVAEVV